MSGTINVLVRDKETLKESIITYKSFKDTSHRFNLIGQVDDSGKLMDSDPNLSPQHQRRIPEKKAADVADAGVSMAVDNAKLGIQHAPDNPTLKDITIGQASSAVLHAVNGQIPTDSIEYVAPGIPAQVVELSDVPSKGNSLPVLSGQPFHVEHDEIQQRRGT